MPALRAITKFSQDPTMLSGTLEVVKVVLAAM